MCPCDLFPVYASKVEGVPKLPPELNAFCLQCISANVLSLGAPLVKVFGNWAPRFVSEMEAYYVPFYERKEKKKLEKPATEMEKEDRERRWMCLLRGWALSTGNRACSAGGALCVPGSVAVSVASVRRRPFPAVLARVLVRSHRPRPWPQLATRAHRTTGGCAWCPRSVIPHPPLLVLALLRSPLCRLFFAFCPSHVRVGHPSTTGGVSVSSVTMASRPSCASCASSCAWGARGCTRSPVLCAGCCRTLVRRGSASSL